MPMPTKAVVLFSGQSLTNAPVTTGVLLTSDFDSLLIEYSPSGAAGASTLDLFDLDISASVPVQAFATPADANAHTVGWGEGSAGGTSSRYLGGQPAAVPARVTVTLGALGVGVVGTLRVIGRRNFKGPSVPQPSVGD